MYSKKQSKIALLACITFLVITFANLFLIVKEADHDCIGDNCPICAVIAQAEDTLKNIGECKPTITAAIPVIFVFASFRFRAVTTYHVRSFSLIAQKIRMNN